MWPPVARFFSRRRWSAWLVLLVIIFFCVRFLLFNPAASNASGFSRRVTIIGQKIRSQRIRNNQTFALLQEPRGACADGTRLLLLVTSALDNFDQRQAIRDTWGGAESLKEIGGRLVFLLGSSEVTLAAVQAEAKQYGDILQEQFLDSYRNLTLKTMMGLRWAARYCDKVNFVVKTDDDIYWNLPFLMSHLRSLKEDRFITGCIKQYSAPDPISMSGAVPPPPGHPLFVAGAGYVISGDLTSDLYAAARRIPLLPVEDVFITGYCAKMAQAWPPKHHKGFSCGNILTDDCDLVQLFNAHKVTPARQYLIWDKFTTDPNPCMDF